MDWSERKASDIMSIQTYTINKLFKMYINEYIYVNRRYQRKLIWGLEEKQLLIDSIIENIPLPAILAVGLDMDGLGMCKNLEIIDGMQRLNAIFSFMLGEFSVEYEGQYLYFDPVYSNVTLHLCRHNDERLIKHDNYLPEKICEAFCDCELSVIITGKDDAAVNMIFSRINSTGRKISNQDLRQSRAIGEFPDLVRRIASDIRMDNTYSDHILLSDMPKISIGSKKHGYGVDLDSIFWRRHDLIGPQNLKESKDEEIIEELLAVYLLKDFKKTKDTLDDLYLLGKSLNNEIERKIDQAKKTSLEDLFKRTFDIFDMIFDAINSNFTQYFFEKKNTKNKDECFKVLFLAFLKLVSTNYTITDWNDIATILEGIKPIFNQIVFSGINSNGGLLKLSNTVYNILEPAFSEEINTEINEVTKEIDERLSHSSIESQMTEFKIGISDFKSASINKKVIKQIAKTLVGMANTTNNVDKGLVIIGIADSRKDYEAWRNEYKEIAKIFNERPVCGIYAEAKKLCGGCNDYFTLLGKCLDREPISSKLKDYVLETMSIIKYHDIDILVLQSKNMEEVSLYNGEKYVRHSNETVVDSNYVKGPEEVAASSESNIKSLSIF